MVKSKEEMSQVDLIMEYFKKNPKREIKHPEIVDWVVAEYQKRTGTVFRDPDRAIRKLSQEGQLIKISKGVYKYDPDLIGGLVIQVGSVMVDTSIKTKLKQLQKNMIES